MKEEYEDFLHTYEQVTNTHDVTRIVELITDDAVYRFTDGEYRGKEQISAAIARTFQKIQDETYHIRNVEWIVVSDESATCRYEFSWRGVIDGKQAKGFGYGTNVIIRTGSGLKMAHEHLSNKTGGLPK